MIGTRNEDNSVLFGTGRVLQGFFLKRWEALAKNIAEKQFLTEDTRDSIIGKEIS